jgi:type I restriction enzyme S subunit
LLSFPIPLPPLPEQRAIAHVLRAVQRAQEATERVIAALRELKKSLMRHLFTYGPVPVDQAEQVKLKETEIGLVPEYWEVVPISEQCKVRGSSISFSKLQLMDSEHGSGVIVHALKVADMNLPRNERNILRTHLHVRLPKQTVQKRAIPPGSVVFPKRGAAIATNKKRLTTAWTVLDPNLIAVIPGQRVDSGYLFFWFLTFDLTELQDPGPTPQLNKKDVEPIVFPLPPLPEQHEIARILQAVDEKIRAEEARQQALEALFQTLLHDLMTAQIRLPADFIARFAVGAQGLAPLPMDSCQEAQP